MVALGEAGFVVAGYANRNPGEELFVAQVPLVGPTRPLLRTNLRHPLRTTRVAPPGLGKIDDGRVAIASTNLRARIRYTTLQVAGDRDEWTELGEQVDQRFAPAIAVKPGFVAVAYVDGGSDDGMRVRMVRLDPNARIMGRHDLTLSGLGAAAPNAVNDEIFFVDPRIGHSVSQVVQLDGVAVPRGEAQIVRPISHLYEPCTIAPVRLGARWLIGYTAMGNSATTAVGLVWAEGRTTPTAQAIVPGTGYGRLQVDGVAAGTRAVFVADAPKARDRLAPRELHLRLALPTPEDVSLSPPVVLTGPDGTAHNGRIARHASGLLAIVFSTDEGIYLQRAVCDERD